jgi:hypothetical protein
MSIDHVKEGKNGIINSARLIGKLKWVEKLLGDTEYDFSQFSQGIPLLRMSRRQSCSTEGLNALGNGIIIVFPQYWHVLLVE